MIIIVNPSTGKLVISKQEIKEVTLKYCKDTLENNAIEKEFEDEIHEKKEKVRTKLAETDGRFEIKQ